MDDLKNTNTWALFSNHSFYFSATFDVVDHILSLYILCYLGSSDTLHYLNVCPAIHSSFCKYSLFLFSAPALPLCDPSLGLDHRSSQPPVSPLTGFFFFFFPFLIDFRSPSRMAFFLELKKKILNKKMRGFRFKIMWVCYFIISPLCLYWKKNETLYSPNSLSKSFQSIWANLSHHIWLSWVLTAEHYLLFLGHLQMC